MFPNRSGTPLEQRMLDYAEELLTRTEASVE
jgi:hypothetical protein